jgi:hypothetical protein
MPKAKTTMAGLKTLTSTADKKLWDKPRKVMIFLMPTYRKPVVNYAADFVGSGLFSKFVEEHEV